MPEAVEQDDLYSKYAGTAQKSKSKKKGKNRDEKSNKSSAEASKTDGKKTKYVNLIDPNSSDGSVLLPGRHECDCEARKHKLVNNCTSCGRIVCAQEGSGPCFFCGELVCTPRESELLQQREPSAEQTRLQERLFGPDAAATSFSHLTFHMKGNSQQAVAQRDKLIAFDQDSVRRTKVIDDDSDYINFEKNPFLTKQQREEMRRKKAEVEEKLNMSRLKTPRTYQLDFAGRKVFESTTESTEDSKRELDVMSDAFTNSNMPATKQDAVSQQFVDHAVHAIKQFKGAKYVPSNSSDAMHSPSIGADLLDKCERVTRAFSSRIQGSVHSRPASALDHGMCLAVRQPFASLLVLGIKTHEGRSWYSSHRGRLWIAASAQPVDVQEAVAIERTYAALWNDALPAPLPDQWKTSCLLGCVQVVDCVPQEQYSTQYPNGLCEDAYVFVCEDAFELPLPVPVQAKHRLFKLDPAVHLAAEKMLAAA